MVVPESEHTHESNSSHENEVTTSNLFPHYKTELHENNETNFDQDLPIAIKKEPENAPNTYYIPWPITYLFKKISITHKACLVSLNAIAIPTTLQEALSNKKVETSYNAEIETSNKTWKLVRLP